MIFSRFGNDVEIVAYCGKHKPPGIASRLVLVKLRYNDGGFRYGFATYLRADGGLEEIDAAVDKAPHVTLEGDELEKAIAQAA